MNFRRCALTAAVALLIVSAGAGAIASAGRSKLPTGLELQSTSFRDARLGFNYPVGSVAQGKRGTVLAGTSFRPDTSCRFDMGGDATYDFLRQITIGRAGRTSGFKRTAGGVVGGTVSSELVDLLPVGDGGFLVVANTLSNASCVGGERGGWRGEQRLFVGRFDARGEPVRGFGDSASGWRDLTERSGVERATSVTGDLDGILIATLQGDGEGSISLTRLDSEGEPDPQFGDDGEQVLPGPISGFEDLERARGHDYLLARGGDPGTPDGPRPLRLLRIGADGVDTGFGDGGMSDIPFQGFDRNAEGAIGVDTAGRPLVAARLYSAGVNDRALGVARLTNDGEPDPAFSGDGLKVIPGELLGSFVGPSDISVVGRKVLVPFTSRASGFGPNMRWSAVRLRSSGGIDKSFGDGGLLRLSNVLGYRIGLVGSSTTLAGIIRGGETNLGTVAGLDADGRFAD